MTNRETPVELLGTPERQHRHVPDDVDTEESPSCAEVAGHAGFVGGAGLLSLFGLTDEGIVTRLTADLLCRRCADTSAPFTSPATIGSICPHSPDAASSGERAAKQVLAGLSRPMR
ncbi:hypothetical protein [Amycolatopsis sp. WAC 01375]|uniref:hypothetical protein n=1 Tax=Amycolatopsis sp. WAC 01375 TaxID=2203194 RepID=UPI001F3034D2|nr:hypothetical protein [Amycolatopsis sp. WAC 01375]